MVVAKFRVNAKKEMTWGEGVAYEIMLNPVYDPDPESENGKFYSATPSGQIQLNIVRPAAADEFEVGREYFVNFSLAIEA